LSGTAPREREGDRGADRSRRKVHALAVHPFQSADERVVQADGPKSRPTKDFPNRRSGDGTALSCAWPSQAASMWSVAAQIAVAPSYASALCSSVKRDRRGATIERSVGGNHVARQRHFGRIAVMTIALWLRAIPTRGSSWNAAQLETCAGCGWHSSSISPGPRPCMSSRTTRSRCAIVAAKSFTRRPPPAAIDTSKITVDPSQASGRSPSCLTPSGRRSPKSVAPSLCSNEDTEPERRARWLSSMGSRPGLAGRR